MRHVWMIMITVSMVIICLGGKQEIRYKIPVMYVLFGHCPKYLMVNVELASRYNDVVVLTDTPVAEGWKNLKEKSQGNNATATAPNSEGNEVKFVQMDSNLTKSAQEFAKHYVHLSKDNSGGRKLHELQNFQRWFILKEYMSSQNIPHAFFGDGDTAVFADMAAAYKQRSECDASIITPGVGNNYSWVSTGVATLWSLRGIEDFCVFTLAVYSSGRYVDTLRVKQRQVSRSMQDFRGPVLYTMAVSYNGCGFI